MPLSKVESFFWRVLLILIFLRPFLSEYAFPHIGFWYIFVLIFFLSIYLTFIVEKRILFSQLLNFSVLTFIFIILFSIVLSGFTNQSLFELYFFIPNFLIFYVVNKLRPEQEKELISIIIFAATIISIYAIYQYFVGFRHLFDYIKHTFPHPHIPEFLKEKRVFATFVSPNLFASYIIMMLFLGMGFFIFVYKNNEIINWIGISIFLMVISLLLTKSLGGILIFILTFLLFLIYISFYLLPNLGSKRAILRKVGFSITSVLLIFILISSLFISFRIQKSFNLNNPNNSIIQRFYYWKASLNMIKDFPIIGIGWRKFESLCEFYKLPPANISRYSHNVFLQITAEMGLLGLLSFLWIVFAFLKTGLRAIKGSNEERALKIGLFFAGCTFLFYNLIDVSFYFGQVSFFWWIILGLFANPSLKNA